LSSQTTFNDGSRFRTSSNAVLQNLASKDDLPVIPSDDEDEDDFNGQLQKRNLFQSLQHNTSSLSIKSGTSSRAQSDSSKLNTNNKPRDSISSNNLTVPSTYSNHPEQNPFKAKTLPPASDPKRDEFAKKMISTIFRPMKLKGTNHDTTNEPATIPKSPVDFPSVTSSSKTTNGNGVPSTPQVKEMPESLSTSTSDSAEVVVYPKEHFSSTSVSQTSHSHDDSVISQRLLGTTEITVSHNTDSGMLTFTNDDIRHKVTTEEPGNVVVAEPVDKIDNLDDQQNTPETNDLPDTSPITQPSPLTSTKLLQGDIAVVREISVPGDFVSDEPSTFPNFQSPPLYSTTTDSNPISPKANSPVRKVEARRKPDINSFLLNLVNPQVVSKEVPEKVQPPKTQPWRPPMRSLQRISESSDSLPSDDFTPAPDGTLARKMEELGRLRRMESRSLMAKSKTSPETLPSPTTATPKAELRPQLQTPQEDDSSDVSTLLREAYVERQQALQTQLNKALAELRDVQAENKRLTSENQSQQRSISRLKIAVDEAKHEQDNSLIQINNQLHVATTSLTLLNKEKKGWQDKLDSMQHKVNASERRIRCLDHLTRHKLESRQEAGYGQPKRRGPSGSQAIPASTDVIGAMRALNEEIFQTCVQFVEGLERTVVIFPSQSKPQAQKVLGVHLTEMMEDQAKKARATSGGYNMLLMQTVLEVFMAHWCSLIIEAFYPPQESFADLLVQLSAQTTRNSGK
jgi:hypothetical protein